MANSEQNIEFYSLSQQGRDQYISDHSFAIIGDDNDSDHKV